MSEQVAGTGAKLLSFGVVVRSSEVCYAQSVREFYLLSRLPVNTFEKESVLLVGRGGFRWAHATSAIWATRCSGKRA